MSSVAEQYASLGVETFPLQIFQLLEKAGDVNDTASPDEVEAFGIHQAGGKDVEVIGLTVGDNGATTLVSQPIPSEIEWFSLSGVISSLSTGTE